MNSFKNSQSNAMLSSEDSSGNCSTSTIGSPVASFKEFRNKEFRPCNDAVKLKQSHLSLLHA